MVLESVIFIGWKEKAKKKKKSSLEFYQQVRSTDKTTIWLFFSFDICAMEDKNE